LKKTPDQKWKDDIAGYRKKCQKIIQLSKNIRYAGVINEYGRTLAGIIQPSVKPLLTGLQVKNEFFVLSMLLTLRKDQLKSLGNLNFILLKHQKVTLIAFQQKKITFYVSIDALEKNIEMLVSKIKKII